jgi:hypothetical protein
MAVSGKRGTLGGGDLVEHTLLNSARYQIMKLPSCLIP